PPEGVDDILDAPSTNVSDVAATLRAAGCVFAEDEANVLFTAAADGAGCVAAPVLAAMVRRRVAGEPLEHVVGWAQFCGRHVAVVPGVFVPRRRSEFLVRHAAAYAGAGA